jgi:hypothetical protein
MVKMLDVIQDTQSDERTIHCVFEYVEKTLTQFIATHHKLQKSMKM